MSDDAKILKERELVEASFRQAVYSLMRATPFYGVMQMSLTLCDDSENTDTFGTDGNNLFYNRAFMLARTLGEVKYIVGATNLHLVTSVISNGAALETRKHQYARAMDHIINHSLHDGGVGSLTKETSKLLDYDTSIITKDMTPTEAFEKLVEKEGEIDDPSQFMDHSYIIKYDEEEDGSGSSLKARIKAAAMAGSTGTMPGFVRDLVGVVEAPKIDYRQHIAEFLSSSNKETYSYRKPHKKSSGDFIMPSRENGNKVKIIFAIDTSGSMSDSILQDGINELIGMTTIFHDWEIHVLSYDTQVHNYQKFDMSNVTEFYNYKPEGGGGTYFSCVYEFIEANAEEMLDSTSKLIMFTDGYDSGDHGLAHKDTIDTLFVVHSHHGAYVPGHGTVAYYTDCTR